MSGNGIAPFTADEVREFVDSPPALHVVPRHHSVAPEGRSAATDLSPTLSDTLTGLGLFLTRYVAFASHHQPVAIALWTMLAHVIEQVETAAFLAITSPEKRSGKTRLMEVMDLVLPRPWRCVSTSESALFRYLASRNPTLMLDEVDAIFGPKAAAHHEPIRAILNAGNRRGTTVARVVGEGKKMKVEDFPIFGPKVLAGIGKLPDTIEDRSIIVRLERRPPGVTVERFRSRDATALAAPLREALQDLSLTVDIRDARPAIPDALDDRAQDGWEPLLAIADAAGGAWPKRARLAAVALSGFREPEDESFGIQLLSDLRTIFAERAVDRIATTDVLDALKGIEESPWSDYRDGRPLAAHGLARLLRPFGVHPRLERIGSRVARGYARDDLADPWSRYLAPSATEAEIRYSVTNGHAASVVIPDGMSGTGNGVTEKRPVTEGAQDGKIFPAGKNDPEYANDDDLTEGETAHVSQ
jgi:hypothetical protein